MECQSGGSPSCVICNSGFTDCSPPTVLYEKGLATLIKISGEDNMIELNNKLKEMERLEDTIFVHHHCRRRFTDKRKRSSRTVPSKRLRSSVETSFSWKLHCFLCGQNAESKRKDRDRVKKVMTIPVHNNVMEHARSRGDKWGETVLGRLENCTDLVAEEAIYHSSCMVKFRLKKETFNKKGRPIDANMIGGFNKVCNWLEENGDCELYTLKEVHQKMTELNEQEASYSEKILKQKLKDRYKEHIYFAELSGKPNVVCFRDMASYIICEMKKKAEETKEDIIAAAAKIVKAELRELNKTMDEYPTLEEIKDITRTKEWVPESLQLFLKYLVPSTLKQISIGQCITQASRPRSVMCPIPFGIGVELEKTFGSKWLLNHLSRFGFSITSDEVLRYKESAIENADLTPTQNNDDEFTQWVADNVDHNLVTLTGKGTFHGMGIISVSSKAEIRYTAVKRLKERKKTSSFVKDRGVQVEDYTGRSYNGLLRLKLKPIHELTSVNSLPPEISYNQVWQLNWFFGSPTNPRPNWAGFMQDVTSGFSMQREDSINFLPIIDLNPSDENCIYSTLIFVIDQAKKINVKTPCITFDQPLWLKATGIIEEASLDIVCRLGGFHTMMSFLGSMCELMKGSGLEDLFAEVYAEHTVTHIMSGKAVSRALRAHFLAEAALTSLLITLLNEETEIDLTHLQSLLEEALAVPDEIKLEDFLESENFKMVNESLLNLKNKLRQKSRTSALWLLYLDYVGVLKRFILAERTSNWTLHVQSTADMLNLFAASGHIHYAKSARFYVQQMQSLPEKYPWLYDIFIHGLHAVRRSNRHWSGLWSDLVIEQTLMRTIKSRGGLTRGRGMTESVRHLWVLSLNHSASIHQAVMELSGLTLKSSEQHIEIGPTRKNRDYQDGTKFREWLEQHNPFSFEDAHLHSLSTGWVSMVGEDEVNCEKAEDLGLAIHQKLDNEKLAKASIKRKDKLCPIESLGNTVKIEKKSIYMSPTILFTRLAAVAQRDEDVEQYFSYEMTTDPMSLFKGGLMRKRDKPALRRALLPDDESISKDQFEETYIYTVDGGALLHRVRWMKTSSFQELALLYVNHVRRNYGSAFIVFDGYENETTKSNEHQRRSGHGKMCQNVEIVEYNTVPCSQARFLSNQHNKTQFIKLISKYLKDDGQDVTNCDGDADTKIVSTALHIASDTSKIVVVVADDTDIAIMLLYHWAQKLGDIIFFQERMQKGWSMKDVSGKIEHIREFLLFIHAWSGCDTVSAPFGKGKASFTNLVKKSDALKEIAITMNDVWAEQDEIGQMAISVFKIMYGGKKEDTLTKLR